jgi:hypothetical protein
LQDLVDRDERLDMIGAAADTVWTDELLQSRIRTAIAALQE